jgi:hypothetical protein
MHVQKHAWTNSPKAQVAASKQGQCEFSHPTTLPLAVSLVHAEYFCRQKIIVTTLEPVWYRDAVCRIDIPANFTCDLASIPPPLWFVLSPLTLAMESLFHDLAYREQRFSRRFADFLLLQMMELRGVPWVVRYPVWAAVRLFGGKAWKQRAAQKKRRDVRKRYGSPD